MLKRNAVLDVVRCILDFLNLILRTLFLQMRRISHWKYLLTDKIVAFTVRAMKESLQLRQKDFIMRLVVFFKMVHIKRQTHTEVNRTVETAFKGRYQRRRRTNKTFVRLKRHPKTVQNCDHGLYSSNNHFS